MSASSFRPARIAKGLCRTQPTISIPWIQLASRVRRRGLLVVQLTDRLCIGAQIGDVTQGDDAILDDKATAETEVDGIAMFFGTPSRTWASPVAIGHLCRPGFFGVG